VSFAPSFKWRRDRREIFVPLTGDLTRLHHFRISSPPGIAIEVPEGQGPMRVERFAVRRPGVHRVDVAPSGSAQAAEGTKIRVWLKQPVDDYRVEATTSGVRVVLPVSVPAPSVSMTSTSTSTPLTR
jgi:hypothetical protein